MDTSDIEQFAKLFDVAMTSKNPTVQKAFKNLMIVASIAEAKGEDFIGPLQTMFDTVRELKKRVDMLEQSKYNYGTGSYTITTSPYYGTSTSTSSAIWDYGNDIKIDLSDCVHTGKTDTIKDEEC